MAEPYYQDGSVAIYHGDCRTIGSFPADVVISDPPYGTKYSKYRWRPGPNGHGTATTRHFESTVTGDREPFDPKPWLDYRGCLFWGFQHFADQLPRGTVLVWIKRHESNYGSFLSDADLAWMKGGYGGVYCRRDTTHLENSRDRLHPTQKPLGLMRWCIEKASKPGDVILDPFMGSGTTLRAAKDLGRQAIGIEIEERYCEIAARRMGQEVFAFDEPAFDEEGE